MSTTSPAVSPPEGPVAAARPAAGAPRRRFVAPDRAVVAPDVFERPPLSHWQEFAALLRDREWPDVARLNALLGAGIPGRASPRFVAQTPRLLGDGMHYERRIAERGEIATREANWHDLLNALVWLRFPRLKAALNARQAAEIARAGPRRRTRAQCALTHFDEAGAIVVVRDPALLRDWDAHDWHALFWRERGAWRDGRIETIVFGHALLEHALRPRQLLVAKVIAVAARDRVPAQAAVEHAAAAIAAGALLNDPQELRPLPLSGIPGWHPDNEAAAFYGTAPCFRPLRPGRVYPSALVLGRQAFRDEVAA